VNERADALLSRMCGILDELPGADSVSCHRQKTWRLVFIVASDDDEVVSLGKAHGLRLTLRRDSGRWRHEAIGERDGGAVKFEVAGPWHRGEPPITA
jgi:hypothetical protein